MHKNKHNQLEVAVMPIQYCYNDNDIDNVMVIMIMVKNDLSGIALNAK